MASQRNSGQTGDDHDENLRLPGRCRLVVSDRDASGWPESVAGIVGLKRAAPILGSRVLGDRGPQPCARMTDVDEGVMHVDFVRRGRAHLADCRRDTVIVATGSCKRPLADVRCTAQCR